MKKNDAEPITNIPRRRMGFGPPRGGFGGAPGGVDMLLFFVDAERWREDVEKGEDNLL